MAVLEPPDPLKDLAHGVQAEVNDLRSAQPAVNQKAYGIMEWWRMPTGGAVGMPRFKAFPSWGVLVRKFSLCSPSSAAAERVFSLLKLVLSKQDFRKLGDLIETSLLLRVNDYNV